MVDIKSWEASGVFNSMKYRYSVGDGYVTNIAPQDGSKLKINGKDWLDMYTTFFSLESFGRMVVLMETKAKLK